MLILFMYFNSRMTAASDAVPQALCTCRPASIAWSRSATGEEVPEKFAINSMKRSASGLALMYVAAPDGQRWTTRARPPSMAPGGCRTHSDLA